MNIEEGVKEIEKIKEMFIHLKNYGWINDIKKEIDVDKAIESIENLLTAYEKEKEANKRLDKEAQGYLEELAGDGSMNIRRIQELEAELEKEKEKNKNIDEFCRKELAFERRLKRENREPDEFNQGGFYVSENIRKIIKGGIKQC